MASADAISELAQSTIPFAYVGAAVPVPFGHLFDYRVEADVPWGTYVRVPFRHQQLIGVLWSKASGELPTSKIKQAVVIEPLPPMPAECREFLEWAATYTVTPLGNYLKAALPPEKAIEGLSTTRAPKSPPAIMRDAPPLTTTQAIAAATLSSKVGQGFSTTLLDGVTGSGKTEVFLAAVEEARAQGGQACVLMPEIALTQAISDRIAKRLGIHPTLWHSGLSPTQRARNWLDIAHGRAKLVIGARSALFLPFANLGLLVVDEEHDGSYRQESSGDRIDRPPHHARDLAIARAHIGKIPIILASATPSLESYLNARNGRYERVMLDKRHGSAGLPTINTIDMRKEIRTKESSQRSSISPTLAQAIEETLAQRNQALLFLNRRGWAASLCCTDCGDRIGCPNCSASLAEHRTKAGLRCHHCNHVEPIPAQCPTCNSDNLTSVGTGVERLGQEAKSLFPTARIAVLSSDLVDDAKQMGAMLEAIQDGQYDLIIGTQLLAKGHNFPNLTLVGVIDADAWSSADDPRATERTFQLLHQVSGRAGRHEKPGTVLLQTYAPENPIVKALIMGDRDGFLEAESMARARNGRPPYVSQAAIIVSGPDADHVIRFCEKLSATQPLGDEFSVEGPLIPRLSVLRNRTRRRFLITANRKGRLQPVIQRWLTRAGRPPRGVDYMVDVDPHDFS